MTHSPNDEEHEGEDLEHEVDEPGVGAAADQPGVVRVGGEAAETQGQVDAADHQVGEQRERQHRGEDHAVHAVQLHVGPRGGLVGTFNHHLTGFILIKHILLNNLKMTCVVGVSTNFIIITTWRHGDIFPVVKWCKKCNTTFM
mgnify:CR=1 FL=1